MKEKLSTALTIAGSDPSGGAGIQADLKTFSSFGVYGQTIITSLTAQNIHEVKSIQDLPQKFIGQQFDSIFEDLGVNAAKIGMLSNRNTLRVVIDKIREYKIKKIVLDPVIAATSGARLLNANALKLLKEELSPLCHIITPNIPEAEALTGITIDGNPALKQAAVEIKKLGSRYVLIKGGHRRDTVNSDDLLYDGRNFTQFKAKRVKSINIHGTGCTFSAAICANLAKGVETEEAVKASKKYISTGLKKSLMIKKKERRFIHYR